MKHLMFFLTTCIVLLFGSCATEKEFYNFDTVEFYEADEVLTQPTQWADFDADSIKNEKIVLGRKYLELLSNKDILNKCNELLRKCSDGSVLRGDVGYYTTRMDTVVYAVSEAGKNFIKSHEHCSLVPYADGKNKSIGWGIYIPSGKVPEHITQEEADEMFDAYIASMNVAINRLLKGLDTRGYVFPQCVVDGIADFMYNAGNGSVKDSKEFYRTLKQLRYYSPYDIVEDLHYMFRGEFVSKFRIHTYDQKQKKYIKHNGLIKRRIAEGAYVRLGLGYSWECRSNVDVLKKYANPTCKVTIKKKVKVQYKLKPCLYDWVYSDKELLSSIKERPKQICKNNIKKRGR